ncbi:hypothetical protein EI969_06110 [Pseudomonas sp. PB101]|nr:hypothetical protein [Pseudomonas sp. PB101]
MGANDNAGNLIHLGVLRFFASRLAPTGMRASPRINAAYGRCKTQFRPSFPRNVDKSSAKVLTGPTRALRSASFTLS